MAVENLQNMLLEYLDQIKVLVSSDIWNNILMDCSKNEVFILILLYRKQEVNMTQIAEHINVPLNTATGIVGRMEKKGLVSRNRDMGDKRVVTICLGENGKEQFDKILKECLYYGEKVLSSLTLEEAKLLEGIFRKIIAVMAEEKSNQKTPSKIRRIIIE